MSRQCSTGDHLVWVVTWVVPVGVGYGLVLFIGWAITIRPSSDASTGKGYGSTGYVRGPVRGSEAYYARAGVVYQGFTARRWYWGMLHVAALLVQLLGMSLLEGSGGGVAAGWVVLFALARLCASVQARPFWGVGRGRMSLHRLDLATGCAFVACTTALLFMNTGENADVDNILTRGVACEARGVLGTATIAIVEAVVAVGAVITWRHIRANA